MKSHSNRAVETLARVRRLLSRIPAVQVNIATQGGQQVNVAGEVNSKKKKAYNNRQDVPYLGRLV